jgi:hypothetical protein
MRVEDRTEVMVLAGTAVRELVQIGLAYHRAAESTGIGDNVSVADRRFPRQHYSAARGHESAYIDQIFYRNYLAAGILLIRDRDECVEVLEPFDRGPSLRGVQTESTSPRNAVGGRDLIFAM